LILDNNFDLALIAACIRDPVFIFGALLHAATLAVTVIVVAVPEGLPMMITVVLSANMRRMLKDNVLVRKLVGIETAGSMNILFTDKTGTLTAGQLQVTGLLDGSGKFLTNRELPIWNEFHRAVVFNTMADMSAGKAVGGNVTDRALLQYAAAHPVAHNITKNSSIPFDSTRKYMAAAVSGDINGVLVKGAPETLLPRCRFYIARNGQKMPMTNHSALERRLLEGQREAVRWVAVARGDGDSVSPENWGDLTLIAIAAIRDDVRREAVDGVRQIQGAGIQVVMITGDAKATAEAIARQTGLMTADRSLTVTSDELSKLSDRELAKILPRICVIARALPNDKSRLVRVAQDMGLVTGMTGDGVNDAPALKRADIGFAMGSGMEVAKEAGDIVILDDNLLSIAKATRYGRTIFKSIRKFIIFQLTLNFCAVGVSVLAPLLGIDAPITVIQMLWINMVMDTLAGLAFGGEPALEAYMKEAPKPRNEPIINGYMWREIVLGGVYATILCLWFLTSSVPVRLYGEPTGLRFLTAFFALFMFTGIFSSFCARTHKINLADRISANKPFIFIMGVVSAVQLGLIYAGGPVFRTNGLSLNQLVFVMLLASTAVLAHIFRKMWYERRGWSMGT
jgi:calcium-translocating P-type ATPase